MTLDLQSLILGALLAGIAVLLRETLTRVGHQRGTLRRDVYELTNVLPLWLSRFHPEFERLHGEFPLIPSRFSGAQILAAHPAQSSPHTLGQSRV